MSELLGRRLLAFARLLLAAFLLAASGLHAQGGVAEVEFPDRDVRIEGSMRWPQWCGKGYVPVDVRVSNGADRPQTFEVEIQLWDSSTSRRTVTAPPGESRFSVLFPAFHRDRRSRGHFDQTSLGLRATFGLTERRTWGVGAVLRSSPVPVRNFVVLTSSPADVGDPLDWCRALGTEHARSYGDPVLDVAAEALAFGRAPTRFEPYTSLDAVVVDTSAGLPPREVLAAVLRYVRLGGNALFLGPSAGADLRRTDEAGEWFEERFAARAEPVAGADVVACGLGSLATLDTDAPLLEDEASRELVGWALAQHPTSAPEGTFAPGGPTIVVGPGGPRTIPAPTSTPTLAPPADDLAGGPDLQGLSVIPYRTLTIGLVLFTLLIGPVNFLVVRRAGRPMLLTATIPAIALLASLAILSFGFLTAGIDSRTAEYGYTVLDQRTHRASTVQLRSLWCGLAPEGFRPSDGAALLPMQAEPLDFETVGFVMDETDGLWMTGDFLPVRRADKQTLLTDRTHRGRLAFERAGEGWRVTNGLGVEVDVLVYADPGGGRHVLDGALADGSSGPLRASATSAREERAWSTLAHSLRRVGYPDLPVMVEGRAIDDGLRARYAERLLELALPPGTYLAVTDGANPFVDDLGVEAERTFARQVVLGIVDGEGGL